MNQTTTKKEQSEIAASNLSALTATANAATATTKNDPESGVHPDLQVQELEQDEEKQTPVKRIKLERVPSERRPSVLYRSQPTPMEMEGIDEDAVTQDESESSKSKPPSLPKRLTPWINYEVFQWTWFLTLCIIAIADRFTWNVWPRQTYTIGAGSAGSDRLSGFKPGQY